MRIGLDVDDVLLPCTRLVVEEVSAAGFPHINIDSVSWDFSNLPTEVRDCAHRTVQEIGIYKKQGPLLGAVEMVQALVDRGHDVFFVTAPPPAVMEYRYNQLQKFFPMVPSTNYVFTKDKSVVKLDVLLDDAPHNLLESTAKHVVRWLKPWNVDCNRPGMDMVSSYPEFLRLVDSYDNRRPEIICLVGPSASGKTVITEKLVGENKVVTPRSVTTRSRREGESKNAYYFVSEDEFQSLVDNGKLVESTCYNGYHYGLTFDEINQCLAANKPVVVPVDINGAKALKKAYGRTVLAIFVRRPLPDILNSLIERKLPEDILLSRLASMKEERINESQCDFAISNDTTVEEAASKIGSLLKHPVMELYYLSSV